MTKCHGWTDVLQHFLPVDVEDRLDCGGKEMIEGSVMADLTSCEVDRKGEPYEGMIFESEAAARAYYDEYAGRAGFLTRVLSSRSLSNETGEKRRDGCTAMLLVKKESAGRWIVRKFVRDHNHPLVVSLPKRRPTFDEKDKRIQELTAELRVKKRLSAAYREQLLISETIMII
ncbi:UNVERIFIED_CONTAM: protein FAR1-RELATED SEQUENCE 5 [Sesamum latifolium]|uniref:Protein FAR1-RELATED SEQUENCE 5 n=1 Tax=Sesamum latifolium TaxID=2727402 RepID=A0AAW2VVK4_9LAMI